MNQFTHRSKWLTRFAMITACFILSSSPDGTQDTVAPIEEQTKSPYLQLEESLRPFGQFALELASDASSRSLVYKEIEKQFDGDYNVLFEILRVRQFEANRVTTANRLDGALTSFDKAYEHEGKFYPLL